MTTTKQASAVHGLVINAKNQMLTQAFNSEKKKSRWIERKGKHIKSNNLPAK